MCVLYLNIQAFFKLKSFPEISELYRLSYVHGSNFLQALLKNRNVAFRLHPLLPPPVELTFSCIEKVQPPHQNAMWFVSDVYRTLCSFRLAYLNCIIQPNPAGFSIVKLKKLELLYNLLQFLRPFIFGKKSLELTCPLFLLHESILFINVISWWMNILIYLIESSVQFSFSTNCSILFGLPAIYT